MNKPITLAACALLLCASRAVAATHCVEPSGSDGCFTTIQAAIDAAEGGDTIAIAAGTYSTLSAYSPAIVPTRMRLTFEGAGAGATIVEGDAIGFDLDDRAKVTIRGITARTSFGSGIRLRSSAELTLEDSELIDNWRGVELAAASRLSMTRSTLVANRTGIESFSKATIRISDSTVRDSTAYGIVASSSKLELFGTTIHDNEIGVITRFRGLTARNSTISRSTFDGIQAKGTKIQLVGVTLAENGGLAIAVEENSGKPTKILFSNTIVSGNGGAGCDAGLWLSRDYNLIDDASGCTLLGKTAHVSTGVDPLLGPLQNNGGATATHALLAGSPAIDAGSPKQSLKGFSCHPTDQRGAGRSGTCDIGAFEF